MVTSTLKTRHYNAYGGATVLARCHDPRILIEGPANTGKTRSVIQLKADLIAKLCPGVRVLFCRQTLTSLRESILVELEDKVWVQGEPAKNGKASRATRRKYTYPAKVTQENPDGIPSELVMGGLEDAGWTYSMQYDLICIFEGWEVARDSIEKLYRANRNHVLCRYMRGKHELLPDLKLSKKSLARLEKHGVGATTNSELAEHCEHDWDHPLWLKFHRCCQQIIIDTNPGKKTHHLNLMAGEVSSDTIESIAKGGLPSNRLFPATPPERPFTRILSRHEDNPACTEEDLERLDALTGSRLMSLRYGLWVSAEGLVWPEYDPAKHLISIECVRQGERDPNLSVPDKRKLWIDVMVSDGQGTYRKRRRAIKWTFASQDFGHAAPGCFGVWGVDYDGRMYLLAEIYRARARDDDWAKWIVALWLEFDFIAVCQDSADPGRIETIDERIVAAGGQSMCEGVVKSIPKRSSFNRFKPAALDLVGGLFKNDRLFISRTALRLGRDEDLVAKRQPVCTVQEIEGYCYPEDEDGKPIKEDPDKRCPDHGCDMVTYGAVYFHWMDHDRNPKPERFPVGTAGWRYGHAEVLEAAAKHPDTFWPPVELG